MLTLSCIKHKLGSYKGGGDIPCRDKRLKSFTEQHDLKWCGRMFHSLDPSYQKLLWPYETVLTLGWSSGNTDLDSYGISFAVTSFPKYSSVNPLIILNISHIMLRGLSTYNRAKPDFSFKSVYVDLNLPFTKRNALSCIFSIFFVSVTLQ